AGREAVALAVGYSGETSARYVLMVEEHGWQRMLRGEQDGSLQIHKRSYPDRWLCRVVLPVDWMEAGSVEMGFLRAHSDDAGAVELMPAGGSYGTVFEVGRIHFDLSRWGE
ncbi:MAG TPA: hypothetical protein VG711_07540, partial [Phycisphaerales bacterium]|nr:hypothetical protein [Phycisphaerales bacterium]